MKPYLVDVPVKINIWTRPECQRKQFEVIKQARPSILFVTSDGGRNEREWQLIYQNRKIYDEEIDWDCKVYKLYMDHNLGMYAMGEKRTELIWNTVDRCIMLEDDILPSVSFFQYCAELLEKYKDDERIECICGMNHLGKSENVLSDYFFSRQGSIWGFAVWKRTIKGRGDFSYFYDSYVMELLKQRTRKNPIAWKRLCAYGQQEKYEGHVASSEFWYEFDMYAQNRVQIVPKYNLISNIGCNKESAHMDDLKQLPRGFRRVLNMDTYMELGILGQDMGNGSEYILNWGSYYFETLKLDSDKPTEMGEAGRIVITDLFNYAFPMIRYDTGDLGVLDKSNPNELPKLKEIYGRVRDCVYATDGRLISPAKVSVMMWGSDGVKQWQFIQKTKDNYILKLNCEKKVDTETYVKKFKGLLGESADIEVQLVDEIPVTSSNKRRAVICNYHKE